MDVRREEPVGPAAETRSKADRYRKRGGKVNLKKRLSQLERTVGGDLVDLQIADGRSETIRGDALDLLIEGLWYPRSATAMQLRQARHSRPHFVAEIFSALDDPDGPDGDQPPDPNDPLNAVG